MYHHLLAHALPSVFAAIQGLARPGDFLPSKSFPGAMAHVISLAPVLLEYLKDGEHLYNITVKNNSPLQIEIDRNGEKREYTFLPGTSESVLDEVMLD